MKRMIECQAAVSPDGRLVLPDEVARELRGEQQVSVSITVESEKGTPDLDDGWEVLLEMLGTAGQGRLRNASEDHDRYLYRR